MASILRTSKFVRYIAGFARNVLVNSPREFESNIISNTQCFCGVAPRNLSTQTSLLSDQSIDSSLRKIDQDVRRLGRISRRDIEEVLEEIRNTKSATSSQSLLVIRCCGNLVPEEVPEIRTKLVQEIWNTLHKLNVPMDISHYNALLRVYLENEYSFSPVDFLADLESKGIEPNRVTYQRLIARYCQVGDIDGATKILQYMREKQMSVNENVFNALIVGHSKTGDMESAQAIINVMSQAGLEPSADTYTTLLSGYALNGDIEKINNLADECEKREIFLLDKDYLEIMYTLAINNFTSYIPKILEKVKKSAGYNQDAINVILRLINKGREDAGLIILRSLVRNTKEDSTNFPPAILFIKQLVKAKRPIETIIENCEQLEKEGMYDRGLLLATETSLQLGSDIAFSLIDELYKKGIQIRQHFFWPLLALKSNNSENIVNILQKMNILNVFPSAETLREYVIPNLQGKSSEIISHLRKGNISIGLAASSLVIFLLQKKEIEEAAIITSRVPAFYNPTFIKKPLVHAFMTTQNLNAFIEIVRLVYENIDRQIHNSQNDEEDVINMVEKSEVIDGIVLELTLHPNFIENFEEILEKLVEYGLSISNSMAQIVEEKLGEKMTEHISILLGRLSSGELTPVPFVKKSPSYVPSHQMNISQLERLIYNLSSKNQECNGLKRQLLTLYYRAKDLEKAKNIYNELETKKYAFTNGTYAQMLDLYVIHSDIEKALEFFDKIKQNSPEKFSLDETKIVRLSFELVKSGRFVEAVKILEETPKERNQGQRNFSYSSLVWRFLNSLAEEGRVDDLNNIFNILIMKDFIEVNNVLLGPLIKVYLVLDNLDEALKKFEWCVNKYKATPWKNELACRLIQAEDADKLQKLTDLSTTVHGEVNSLYDLVFAFVECGRIRQARKILETPGLQNRSQRINTACERYQQEGLIRPLEGLKDATKDLNHIDRSDIYYQLLLSYIKNNDSEKSMGLWTQMQEEDLAPTDQFLITLANYLKDNNIEIPFVVPSEHYANSDPVIQPTKFISQFRLKLRTGDIDEALQIKNTAKEKLSVKDLSSLIEKLAQKERLTDASAITLELLQNGNSPIDRVFRFLLNKLSNAGDIETLQKFSVVTSSELKKNISFDNKVCNAYLVAGKGEEYLDNLSRQIDVTDEENLVNLTEQFPRGGAFGILQDENLIEKFEKVALKYADRGILAPLNILWTYHFIKNNQKAEVLWNDYVKNSSRIMFQKILKTARENKDDILAKKLVEHLKNSSITSGALGNAYSCLLDVLTAKQENEEAVRIFKEAVQKVSVDNLNRTAVLRVKEIYQKQETPFNYSVPLRKKNNTFQNDI